MATLPQNTTTALSLAALLGAVAGGIWWAAYTPHVFSPVLLVGGHVLVALVWQAALCALGPHWRNPLVPGFSLILGLVLAPMALGPLHDAGTLGGVMGGVVDVAVVGASLVVGAAAGWAASRFSPLVGTAIDGVATAGLVGLYLVGLQSTPDATLPTAATVADGAMGDTTVLVYGIDGADWQVVEPMMAAGELPNLTALRERGRHGVLRSDQDMMASPVVWTTVFTGQERMTHGVSSWHKSDARSRLVPMGWDILDSQGVKTLTVNVPGSWPPTELQHGTLISGFPIPGLDAGDTGHLTGLVASNRDTSGYLTTLPLRGDAPTFTVSVPVASPRVQQTNFHNPLLDTAGREGLLPMLTYDLDLSVTAGPDGVRIEGFDQPLELQAGQWSPWQRIAQGDDANALRGVVRVHVVEADATGATLYFSPTFQDPEQPREAYTNRSDLAPLGGAVPFIVEPVGWTAHRDERIAHLIPDLLLQASARHVQATLDLLTDDTQFVAVVYTATDRLQHGYYGLHAPDAYAGVWTPHVTVAGQDYVAEAYRQADRELGRLLAELPDDALVFVVSDHGVSPNDLRVNHQIDQGESGHRSDGIWIAAGGPITAGDTSREMGVADVLPTVFECAGMPVAADWEGQVLDGLCPIGPTPVPTYIGVPGQGSGDMGLAECQQLVALGYLAEGSCDHLL